MVYFIANSIALGLLSGEGSSNLWQTAQTWWHRFFQFLLQLEEQPMRRHSQLHGDFFSKGVQEWIAENEYGINTAFKWPSLTEIGKLAFRSQVVICLPLFPILIQYWHGTSPLIHVNTV